MDKQAMNTMIAIAGMVLGALAASSNPSAAVGLMRGGQALSVQNQLAYSRDAEREADRIGFLILEGSGYDVNGMPAFFQRLQKARSKKFIWLARQLDHAQMARLKKIGIENLEGEIKARTGDLVNFVNDKVKNLDD
jgi:predicted Zn-dependent protease